jgi:branched-chain amino acid aminotransferase
MEEEKVYEVILVHPEGYITEGSRSNLFMIKNNEVYTPKVTDILPGITRKYILQVCKDLNLILNERRIFRDELFAMDALFITGTSPKVLPIRNIYYANFDVKHPVLRLIMKKFDELIENYLKNSPNFF